MGYRMTPEAIESFLAAQKQKGLTSATLERYRYALEMLYQALPESREIQAGTLLAWREALLDGGFAPSTINSVFSVCNGFLDYAGHREYQAAKRIEVEDRPQPELTRVEYLRLLQTAKSLNRERAYMLVMTLGSTGLFVHDLILVTVEALREGKVLTVVNRKRDTVRLPPCLCEELLAYAQRNGIASGPVFITKNGLPLDRTAIAREIQQLSAEAGLPEGKATGRALRNLWRKSRADIRANIEALVEQAMDHQLELEQFSVGWCV